MRSFTLPQKAVDLPAMYIQATKDLLLPDNSLNGVRALLPQLEVHRVEGPHLIMDTHPETCARLVAGFLDHLEDLDGGMQP
jgi:pimeloyl-ACP methyl ester carboxylesterase